MSKIKKISKDVFNYFGIGIFNENIHLIVLLSICVFMLTFVCLLSFINFLLYINTIRVC